MKETLEENQNVSIKMGKFFKLVKINIHVAALLKIKNNWMLWKQEKTDHIDFKSFNLKDLKEAVKEICKLAQCEGFPRE